MSTLNRMLNALEARGVRTAPMTERGAAVRPVAGASRNPLRLVALGVAAATTIGLALWGLQMRATQLPDGPPADTAHEPAQATRVPVAAAPPGEPAPPATTDAATALDRTGQAAPTATEAQPAPSVPVPPARGERATAPRVAVARTSARTDAAAVRDPRRSARAADHVAERAVGAAATDAGALARRGAQALASGHVQQAIALLRESLARDDAQPEVHLDLAAAWLYERNAHAAWPHVERALALYGEPARWPLRARQFAAMTAAQLGRWRQAADWAEGQPFDPTLTGIEAAAWLQLGRADRALTLYDRLVAVEPGQARFWLGRASAQRALGLLEAAQQSLAAAAERAREPAVQQAVMAEALAAAQAVADVAPAVPVSSVSYAQPPVR